MKKYSKNEKDQKLVSFPSKLYLKVDSSWHRKKRKGMKHRRGKPAQGIAEPRYLRLNELRPTSLVFVRDISYRIYGLNDRSQSKSLRKTHYGATPRSVKRPQDEVLLFVKKRFNQSHCLFSTIRSWGKYLERFSRSGHWNNRNLFFSGRARTQYFASVERVALKKSEFWATRKPYTTCNRTIDDRLTLLALL